MQSDRNNRNIVSGLGRSLSLKLYANRQMESFPLWRHQLCRSITQKLILLPVVDLANKVDKRGRFQQRFYLLFKVSFIGFVYLSRNFELNARLLCDFNCSIRALFRGDSTEERKILFWPILKMIKTFRVSHERSCILFCQSSVFIT
jgi:hypothetical protein